VAGLARLVDAQPAPMMTIFDLMVRVPAERMAARLRLPCYALDGA
jgi:hypothetical protein